jgi:hypothetical protein
VDATRRQDIEAYMARIPDGLTIQTEAGVGGDVTITGTRNRA